MKKYIKLKSESNNEFIKVSTRFSKEHKSLLLSIQHVNLVYIEKDKIQIESFKPTKGIVVKVQDMQRDNKKFVETFEPENMQMYIDRIVNDNNLIIDTNE